MNLPYFLYNFDYFPFHDEIYVGQDHPQFDLKKTLIQWWVPLGPAMVLVAQLYHTLCCPP